MISAPSLAIVEATVEVVRENGTAITQCFYTNLLAEHPELKNLFNMANQASGEQQQALAGAVYAYAANIQNPDKLEPVINRIAHKHASLGIQPAQYTVVGRHLMGAIKEVLGDAVTPEVVAAWDEVYWLLACDLIARESRLYTEQAAQQGDDYWQPMQVTSVTRETDEITSFELSPASADNAMAFLPGQYMSVRVGQEHSDYHHQIRQYSLSDSPDKARLRLTIKNEATSEFGMVSSEMHQLRQGDTVFAGKPYGDFVLDQEKNTPKVLISAGVGITPMISMLNHLVHTRPNAPVHFYHANKSADGVALKADIQRAIQALANLDAAFFLETGADSFELGQAFAGYMDLSSRDIPKDADVYLCGPLPFLRLQRAALLDKGIGYENIHYEVFGPDLLEGLA